MENQQGFRTKGKEKIVKLSERCKARGWRKEALTSRLFFYFLLCEPLVLEVVDFAQARDPRLLLRAREVSGRKKKRDKHMTQYKHVHHVCLY